VPEKRAMVVAHAPLLQTLTPVNAILDLTESIASTVSPRKVLCIFGTFTTLPFFEKDTLRVQGWAHSLTLSIATSIFSAQITPAF